MHIGGRESFSVDDLAVGTTCLSDLYDEDGLLLIASGVIITTSLVDKLRSRGITALHGRPAEPGAGKINRSRGNEAIAELARVQRRRSRSPIRTNQPGSNESAGSLPPENKPWFS